MRTLIVLVAVLIASCGAPLMRLPAGPGGPAPDIKDVITEATVTCRAVSSMTAEVAVTGSVGGRRLRARLLVGVAPPASARVEAFASSQQVFIFVARGADATLLLTRGRRVLEHGQPDEVLEAVTGVPMDASDLRLALLGCIVGSDTGPGRRLGDDWRVVPEGTRELYLHRDARTAPWRLVTEVHRDPGRPAWRAEYRDFQSDLPRTIHLASSDKRRFDLQLALSQVDLNVKLEPSAFEIRIPPSADPITIEELQRSGPLAEGGADERSTKSPKRSQSSQKDSLRALRALRLTSAHER